MKARVAHAVLLAFALIALLVVCPRFVAAQGTAHASCDGLDPADGSTWDAWAPEYYVYIDLHTYVQKVYITGGYTGTDYIAIWHLFLAQNGATKDGDPTSGARF